MKHRINIKRGLRRIYYVILLLSIIPLLVGSFFGTHFLIKKSEHQQKVRQQKADLAELKSLIEKYNIDWEILDHYLARSEQYAIRPSSFDPLTVRIVDNTFDQFDRVADKSSKVDDFGADDEIISKRKDFAVNKMFEVYGFRFISNEKECPLEIKHFIKTAYNYEIKYRNFWPRSFSYIDDDIVYQSFLIAGGMIIIPPILYGFIAKMLIPFIMWIVGGFVEDKEKS